MAQKKVLPKEDPIFGEIREMFNGYSHEHTYNSSNSLSEVHTLARKGNRDIVHREIFGCLLGQEETREGDIAAKSALHEYQIA